MGKIPNPAPGEVNITGCTNLHTAGAFAEIIVFDGDGPEGYFERRFFKSSYEAAHWFVTNFGPDMHCRITQTSPEQ